MSDTIEFSPEFAALVERIKVKAIAGEDTAALVKEAEDAASAFKGENGGKTTAGRKAMRDAYREAVNAQPATPAPLEGTVVTGAERAADTATWQEIPDAPELLDNAAGKFIAGTNLHLKTADTAAEIARIILDARSRATHKGKPDMLARGAAARGFKPAILTEAVRVYMEQHPDADVDDVKIAGDKMDTAINNALRNELVYWARNLTDKSEDAERFAFALEGKPEGTTLAEAVRAEYGIATESPAEKMKARSRELREAAERKALESGEGSGESGEGDEGAGEGSASAPDKPKEVAQIDKIVKAVDHIAEASDKGAKLAALEEESLESIKSRLEAEAARLIRLAGRYADEIKRRAEEENV